MNPKNNRFDRSVLSIIVALETVVFCNFFLREIAWYPPLNSDQAVFLSEAYKLEERVFSKGIGELWKALWRKGNPNGLLLPIEGALLGMVFGGSRLAQLSLNFIAFGALQIVAFSSARTVWTRRAYGYLALGLILCQTTAWFWAGGLFDFRFDFVAYCLYGIWVCAAIRSNLFLDRRWAIGCGLIGAVLVLHRFLTIVYLLGVSAGFGAACIVVCLISRGDRCLDRRLWERLYNLALSSGILVAVVSPILIINRSAIRDYYWVGHVTSQEKYIRATEVGITGLAGHLLYYPESIVKDHLGATFFTGSILAIVTGLVAHLLNRSVKLNAQCAPRHEKTFPLQTIFLLGASLGPIVVLTADIAKSPVVGGVVGVPAALLIVTVASHLGRPESSSARRLVVACSLVILALGLLTQFSHASRHLPEYAQRRDLKQLAELDKWLVDYASKQGWHYPRISFDVISGWLNSYAICSSGYEQTRQIVEFQSMLGSGLMEVERTQALSLLGNSHFVILTTQQKTGVYPFYRGIERYWTDLKAWADKNMMIARIFRFEEAAFTATIYVRPTATISGLSGGCATLFPSVIPLLPGVSPARTALPAAHFVRTASTPVTDLVH
jgi:hypothetical protein